MNTEHNHRLHPDLVLYARMQTSNWYFYLLFYVSVQHMHTMPTEARVSAGSLGTGVIRSCELLGLNMGPLEEHSALL